MVGVPSIRISLAVPGSTAVAADWRETAVVVVTGWLGPLCSRRVVAGGWGAAKRKGLSGTGSTASGASVSASSALMTARGALAFVVVVIDGRVAAIGSDVVAGSAAEEVALHGDAAGDRARREASVAASDQPSVASKAEAGVWVDLGLPTSSLAEGASGTRTSFLVELKASSRKILLSVRVSQSVILRVIRS